MHISLFLSSPADNALVAINTYVRAREYVATVATCEAVRGSLSRRSFSLGRRHGSFSLRPSSSFSGLAPRFLRRPSRARAKPTDSGGIFPVDIFLVGMRSRYVREALRSKRPRCSYRFHGLKKIPPWEFEIASSSRRLTKLKFRELAR